MKGKLIKQDDRWYVTCMEEGEWETFYPLCIDDVNEIKAWEQIFDNVEARIAANQDVDFELEDYWETGLEGSVKVARIVHPMEHAPATESVPAPDELQEELRRVRVCKNAHVRAQRYTLASIYREAEKELQSLIKNQKQTQ